MTARKPRGDRLQAVVAELIDVKQAIVQEEALFVQQKAEHNAKLKQLQRIEGDVMSEMRGEGRQERLRFDRRTGEVIEPESEASDG